MNVHSPIDPITVSDAIDRLDELRAVLEAMHMMAAALEAHQANAFSRMAIISQGMIDNIQEGLRPGSSAN